MKSPASFIAITSEGGLLPADFLHELPDPESIWKQDNGKVMWSVRIPAKSCATALLPAKSSAAVRVGRLPLKVIPGCQVGKVYPNNVECCLESGDYKLQFPAPVNVASRLSELQYAASTDKNTNPTNN